MARSQADEKLHRGRPNVAEKHYPDCSSNSSPMACQHRQHCVLRTVRKREKVAKRERPCGAQVGIAQYSQYRIKVLTRRRITISW